MSFFFPLLFLTLINVFTLYLGSIDYIHVGMKKKRPVAMKWAQTMRPVSFGLQVCFFLNGEEGNGPRPRFDQNPRVQPKNTCIDQKNHTSTFAGFEPNRILTLDFQQTLFYFTYFISLSRHFKLYFLSLFKIHTQPMQLQTLQIFWLQSDFIKPIKYS